MKPLPETFTGRIGNLYGEKGRAWLKALPTLIADLAGRWSLTVDGPLESLNYNYIAPAIQANGEPAILKLGVPNPELTTEIEALKLYAGRGSVRLLASDREWGALLLERLLPGATLWPLAEEDDAAATRIAAQVMQQLWRPAPPDHSFHTVEGWAKGMARLRRHFDGGTGPLPKRLVAKAETLYAELLPSMGPPVVLHGDLHQENILQAERLPWLAIDPKGVVGEAAYEVGALMRNMSERQLAGPDPVGLLRWRLAIFAEVWEMDRERLWAWSLAQAVLSAWWCIEDNETGWEGFLDVVTLIDQAGQ